MNAPDHLFVVKSWFRCQRSNIGDFNAFLLHDVCLQTLQAMLKLEIPSGALFSFCQALANDYQKQDSSSRSDMFRNLARFDVLSPTFGTLAASGNIPNLTNNHHESRLDKLPLDSSSFISFSIPSLETSSFIYTIHLGKENHSTRHKKLVAWIQKLDDLACILKVRLSYLSSFEVPPGITCVSHSEQRFLLGYQQITIFIPSTITDFNVYFVSIHGKRYISGLEGIPCSTQISIGACFGITHRISFSSNKSDLGFVADSLRIRSIRFGKSGWSSEVPSNLDCFEGLSINNDNELALKFRHITGNTILI
ncbi:a244abed-1581-43f4-a732-93147350d3ef [Sclerotinia trifoliorum]|uniref:A244abed-1581-43f4-a732-93147350d3ef n=1 Tax=Sclerotinia trifoliorum TaxID=28548 RepID=A0A8H2W0A9_9HELO|nr:a244abed-1581-43f4-a732-93147350d3ef [Sclerotinia trifoliorum]